MSFNYALRRVEDVVVLDLSGRLVFGQGAPHALHEAVHEQLAQGCKKILINLRNVTYTDTGGIGAMIRELSSVKNQGGSVRFCEANGSVLEVLRATRLDTVLKASEDEPTAIRGFPSDNVQRKSSVA